MRTVNLDDFKDYIPHRYPFLFIDRILDFVPGKSVIALKNVSANEPQFTGHFPQQAIMPGVLMIEALAQAGGLMLFFSSEIKPDPKTNWSVLAGVDEARFKKIVTPGDQLILSAEVIKERSSLVIFDAKATVGDELACSAKIMIARGGLK